MNAYLWLKAVHLLAVAIWFGAAVTVILVNRHFAGTRDPGLRAPGAMMSDFVGSRVIAPAGGIALLTGIATAVVGHVGMPLWIWWGLAVAVIVLSVGGTLLRLGFARLARMAQDPATRPEDIAAAVQRLRLLSILATLLLLSAMMVMVLKPA